MVIQIFYHMFLSANAPKKPRHCPTIRRRYGIKNKAAIALQCKSNVNIHSCLVLYSIKSSHLRTLPKKTLEALLVSLYKSSNKHSTARSIISFWSTLYITFNQSPAITKKSNCKFVWDFVIWWLAKRR